jgi:hypothetical protein
MNSALYDELALVEFEHGYGRGSIVTLYQSSSSTDVFMK